VEAGYTTLVLISPGICFTGFGKFLLGSVKCVPPVGFFGIQIVLNSILAGAPHQTLLGKLTTFSQTPWLLYKGP